MKEYEIIQDRCEALGIKVEQNDDGSYTFSNEIMGSEYTVAYDNQYEDWIMKNGKNVALFEFKTVIGILG